MNVKLSTEQKIKVLNCEDLVRIMQQILMRENKIGRNKEHFWIVCLANNNRILMIELISLGTVNSTLVEPMEVFSFALQKRAVQIILVHNHPSGETEPSEGDNYVTDRMMAIGKFINVPVLDHLIITETSYLSYLEVGLLDKIAKETSFDLTFKKQEEFNLEMEMLRYTIEQNRQEAEEKLAKAQKNAELAAKKEVALKQLKDGISIENIIKYTGLTLKQVEKLRDKM
ncbi:DNA repair protein RadC [Pseudarcicella hirudinis]|uniref:DNA repair protein RadC n=1 Tax=Pseudarcicella hirudinis TaxID=1079859 RepID=A0A1I5VEN2_9BACT|nr:JAB domain-containing protein [Pseudarcicella hirudinis]SFQ05446.1 DNA repair protein RadC [Pseudarcicella hirudinis]